MAHNEVISNAVENISFRLAEKGNGIVFPAELLPYLPISLGMIIDVLDEVSGESDAITPKTVDGFRQYIFKPAKPLNEATANLAMSQCVICDTDIRARNTILLCDTCSEELKATLIEEAEVNGWPAQAVYEHEICYLSARSSSPVSAEKLASSSRFTLRRMRKKLDQMQKRLTVTQKRDPETDSNLYTFATFAYPREAYRKNIQWIRLLPASVTEDVEIRIIYILTSLGILFLTLLALAFWGFPFPLLLLFILITAPILAVVIWNHRSKLDSKEK